MAKLSERTVATGRDGDTEQRILEAARVVFVRRGTAGARMQEIAAEAGVNQALLHYYFRSKERLAEAVFRQVAGRIVPTILGLLGSDLPIEAKVEQIVAAYVDAFSRSPFLPGYILSELHHHPERATQLFTSAVGGSPNQIVPAVLEKLRTQIDARAREGSMRPIAPEQFMVNLLSLCVFPFAARPFLSVALGFDDDAFARFIAERKRELPRFFLNALRL
jgi:TetR/AcrR family transcriptional regulator